VFAAINTFTAIDELSRQFICCDVCDSSSQRLQYNSTPAQQQTFRWRHSRPLWLVQCSGRKWPDS